ncbi:MAG TPA: hypothetical protein VF158_14065 [Longimicrobiales bacterium]
MTYQAGAIGGQEKLRVVVRHDGATAEAAQTLDIRWSGLSEFGADAHHVLIGTETPLGQNHLSNHWAFLWANDQFHSIAENILKLANEATDERPYVIQYNDMSLESGGTFDINGNFAPAHYSHNRGVDADIAFVYGISGGGRIYPNDPGARRLSLADLRRAVAAVMQNAVVVREGDHYHVRLLPCP